MKWCLYYFKDNIQYNLSFITNYFYGAKGVVKILNITSASGNAAEILQIAATDGKDSFNIYAKPCHTISPGASAAYLPVWQLFYQGKPVSAVSINEAIQKFLEWLRPKIPCILIAHNCKAFDSKFLVRALDKCGRLSDFCEMVSGFADSLPAFRDLLPERKSYSQESLVIDLLCQTYEVHNALSDVKTLFQLVDKFLNVKLLQKHSFDVTWAAECEKFLKQKRSLVNTLQPLVAEKFLTTAMASKCACNTSNWHTKGVEKKVSSES